MFEAHPSYNYYAEAEDICRDENDIVNYMTELGTLTSWIFGLGNKSEAEILESIRVGLVNEDKLARQQGLIDPNTNCVYGNTIDSYHNKIFSTSGIDIYFYGGNWVRQGFFLNPVPKDSRPQRNPATSDRFSDRHTPLFGTPLFGF